MRETGVVRKIDELGRIVIPKEIRKTLGIRNGENLEIFIDKNNICLQKHLLMISILDTAKLLVEFAYDTMGIDLVIMDTEKVVASTKKEFNDLYYNETLNQLLSNREIYESKNKENLFSSVGSYYYYVYPLIIAGDIMGLIILINTEAIYDYQKKIIRFISKILLNKVDI